MPDLSRVTELCEEEKLEKEMMYSLLDSKKRLPLFGEVWLHNVVGQSAFWLASAAVGDFMLAVAEVNVVV